MDWSKFKIGLGPMSPEIVDAVIKYSHRYNFSIMLIASRNQVDYDSGYAFSTDDFVRFVKDHKLYNPDTIKICRDHCGPYFSDKDKSLTLEESIVRCKSTIEQDIDSGFDLLHIDVSRVEESQQENLASHLIDTVLSLNNQTYLEFGSEDNTGENLFETYKRIDDQIKFAKNYNQIQFLVSQTGSLTKHTQVGTFNEELSSRVANKIHNANLLFKEHNADYLSIDQVRSRRKIGIDAVNIAPQLGYLHSCVLSKLSYYYEKEFENFKEYVLEKKYWKKWVTDDITDDNIKFLASAHYFYDSEYGKTIKYIVDAKKLPFQELLFAEVLLALDQYRLGFGDYYV